jgi:Tfp pilus assembly protein PilX
MGVLSKARRRVETLLAWLVALVVIGLLGVGAAVVVMEVL